MRGRKGLDALICICACALCAISYYYLFGKPQLLVCSVSAMIALLFLVLLCKKSPNPLVHLPEAPTQGAITELVLLGEEGQQMGVWELFGKTGLVIGRDVGENQVNVNLNRCTYASMIDVEHAVLNHSSNQWYVEDLGSKNGVSIRKAEDSKQYRLVAGQPCLLEQGDIIYIAMTRLLVR